MTETPAPRGIIPALVTPFDTDEALDLDALERVVDRVLSAGVHGLFVAGSQGEFWALSADEHREVISSVVKAAAGSVPVFAGASAITTRDAVALARAAESAGADAVTVLPPFFVKPSERELEHHFESIAAAVDLPLILYNQPQRTGLHLSTRLVAKLALRPHFVAVKDSSADLNQTIDYIGSAPKHFSVLIGNDAQIAYGLLAGAAGAIASTANVVPELCVAIYDAISEGAIERARALQARLARLRGAFELGTFPVVVKEALALAGEPVGSCRGPVGPLSAEARELLRQTLVEVGHTTPSGVQA
jgi:4-hydroxy-tetrahydrodipicolinate synthase